ncbi:hypothetical protein ACFSZT_27885 [Prauserella oleivorans]|uniref:hypothetical protein n=1 Tax=Prauserella oleivorans TaxID=1478153 RepID=UPI00363E0773
MCRQPRPTGFAPLARIFRQPRHATLAEPLEQPRLSGAATLLQQSLSAGLVEAGERVRRGLHARERVLHHGPGQPGHRAEQAGLAVGRVRPRVGIDDVADRPRRTVHTGADRVDQAAGDRTDVGRGAAQDGVQPGQCGRVAGLGGDHRGIPVPRGVHEVAHDLDLGRGDLLGGTIQPVGGLLGSLRGRGEPATVRVDESAPLLPGRLGGVAGHRAQRLAGDRVRLGGQRGQLLRRLTPCTGLRAHGVLVGPRPVDPGCCGDVGQFGGKLDAHRRPYPAEPASVTSPAAASSALR